MRKILLVTNDLGPRAGGIETFILGLLDQLPGSAILIYTAAQAGSEEFDQKLIERLGVAIIRDKNSILLPTPWLNRRVRTVMRDYESEIIWFGAAMPLAWMSGLLKRAGAKRIVAITHGHEVWWAKLPPFRQIFTTASKSIDVLTYLGSFTRSALEPIVNPRCQLIQLAPGIAINHFAPGAPSEILQKDLRLEGRDVLLCVGRLVHRKGQDKLLAALPRILLQHPDALLLFVGTGPRQKKMEQLVSRYNLQDHVRFVGRVGYADLPEYFRLADLFVMPSRSRFFGLEVEGLGIVYLEASATGIAVLAGESGGAPDAVRKGVTGETVDGRNIEAISTAINDLLANPKRLNELGAAGRTWTEESWDWRLWGERFRSLLLSD